jgi:hypothetical protein
MDRCQLGWFGRCGKTNYSLIFIWIEWNVFGGLEDACKKNAGHSFGILVDI